MSLWRSRHGHLWHSILNFKHLITHTRKNNLYWHSHTLLQTALMHLYTHADTHTRLACLGVRGGSDSDKMWSSHWWLQLMCLHSSPVTRCGRVHINTRRNTITYHVDHKFWKTTKKKEEREKPPHDGRLGRSVKIVLVKQWFSPWWLFSSWTVVLKGLHAECVKRMWLVWNFRAFTS